ncbi:UDP-glucose 4-epimerase GalE [Candidatus Roizmanbacteria bacterium]|nr:UDP-glucose 4-epimerase GalE [Candidatus Roizmanbacteria bacterium]
MAKILITGCAGYIGSIAADLFLKSGYEVVGFDNFQTGYKRPIEILQERYKDKFKFYGVDLKSDLSPIFSKEQDIKVVVHYAASCVVDESMNNPHKYFLNNPSSTLNLLETMSKYQIKKIVFSSTCALYGEAQYVPIDEKHPTLPNNVYGESKLMAEKIVKWYGKLRGIDYIVFRYFNVSGASEDGVFGYSKSPSTHLTENAVKSALGIVPFFLTYQKAETPDGSPIRDYVNVLDLNEAHMKAVDYLINNSKSEVINLGTGSGNSVLEIVNKVQELTGKKFDVKPADNPREGEAPKLVASIEKAKNILGWSPRKTIEDSVKSLLIWYKNHPNGWEK